MTAPMQNQGRYLKQDNYQGLPLPAHFPKTEKVTYERIVSSLMNVAYDNEKGLKIRFLNGSEQDSVINGLLCYLQNSGNIKLASKETGKTMTKERRAKIQSVDDFVRGVRFTRVDNTILLFNPQNPESFKDYTLDIYAMERS